MPELPEVEVTRHALAPAVERRTVLAVQVRERRLRWPVADLSVLLGRRVERLARRGKYLLWEFAHGTLISHLGMSGAWRVWPHGGVPPPRAHDHVDLAFEEHLIRLTDPRRFGALLWHPVVAGPLAQHPLLARLGMEPFDARFDASEALFRAGIHPSTPAARLSRVRCERLALAVRDVLSDAIRVGGSTLRDFYSAAGEEGYFMLDAAVYERAGEPCRICGTRVRRLVQGQRASYYCPSCQRR